MDSDHKSPASSGGSPSPRPPADVQMSSADEPRNETASLTKSGARPANQFSIDYILSANSAAAAALAAKQHQDQTMAFVDQLTLMNQQRAQLVAAAAVAAAAPRTPPTAASAAPATGRAAHATASRDEQLGADKQQHQGQAGVQLQNYQQQAMAAALGQQQQQQQQAAHPNFLYFMACMLLQQQQAAALANQQQLAGQVGAPQAAPASPTRESLALLAQLSGAAVAAATAASSTNGSRLAEMPASFCAISAQPNSFQHQLGKPPATLKHADSAYVHMIQQHQQRAADLAGCYSPLMAPLDDATRPHLPAPPGPHNQHHSHATQHLHQNHHRHHSSRAPPQQQQHSIKMLDRSFHQRQLSQAGCNSAGPPPPHQQSHQAPPPPSTNNFGAQSNADKLDNLKPAHSYIGLIGMCILSSPEKRMVLNDVYQFILDHYPYYRNRGSGWRNSVRHNLSLNECFQKAGRAANGKGHYWTIHPANMEDFMNGDFRRRRAQRKVRRWNNMDVPSDESDDESMEDATRPPLPEHFKRSIEMHRRLELSFKQQQQAAAAAGLSLGNILPLASSPFSPLYAPQTNTTSATAAAAGAAGRPADPT